MPKGLVTEFASKPRGSRILATSPLGILSSSVLWNSMKAMGYSMEFDFPMEFPEIVLRSDQTVEFSPEGRSFLVNVKIVTIFDFRFSVASLM